MRHSARRLQALAARIRAAHPDVCDGARVASAEATSTGIAIVLLERRAPLAVLKVALTESADRALARETRVLEELHADDRLGGWRALLPRPFVAGVIDGHRYRLDTALRGRSLAKPIRSAAGAARLLGLAAASIAPLHRATASRILVDDAIAVAWVDSHIETLARGHAQGGLRARLERVRGELREALIGRELPAGWIHGDFWLGNILASDDCRAEGIVDWETAGALEHPLHDLLHLVLYSRRLACGRELGHIVRRQIARPEWNPSERAILEEHAPWWREDTLSHRHAHLLYWLRHAAIHARQQDRRRVYRYRIWERRNIAAVVAQT